MVFLRMRASSVSTAQESPTMAPTNTRRHIRQVINELAETIRERDRVTYDHCRRVAIYAQRLARAVGLQRTAARTIAQAALVHDLGKTWMQNEVLNKPSALSLDERHEMERHPIIAARIMMAYDAPDELIDIVRHHHEAYDGSGYPDGIKGAAIPLGARILTIADVFDALTTQRPYKEAMSLEVAREHIAARAGKMFDPAITDVFLHLLNERQDFQIAMHTTCPLPAIDPTWDAHDNFDLAS